MLERTTLKIKRGELANRSLCTTGTVGGTVPATLSLTLGAPATFGALRAGRGARVRREYEGGRDQHRRQRDARGRRPGHGQHGQARQRRVRARAATACGGVQPGGRSGLRARAGHEQHTFADLDRTGQQRLGDGGLQAGHRRW